MFQSCNIVIEHADLTTKENNVGVTAATANSVKWSQLWHTAYIISEGQHRKVLQFCYLDGTCISLYHVLFTNALATFSASVEQMSLLSQPALTCIWHKCVLF